VVLTDVLASWSPAIWRCDLVLPYIRTPSVHRCLVSGFVPGKLRRDVSKLGSPSGVLFYSVGNPAAVRVQELMVFLPPGEDTDGRYWQYMRGVGNTITSP